MEPAPRKTNATCPSISHLESQI
ncbi:hypothetical protein CCACVL1_00446 [Corchorus capsularis]|uniref:Uncharacterized protein n=1 Tax=Corchorus capsularis TaxID=210143 RepID=A0A1R3KWT7_COCAP|nr:hypothetical protein CCACVL1_00446 [Corchorus capsularis]